MGCVSSERLDALRYRAKKKSYKIMIDWDKDSKHTIFLYMKAKSRIN